MCDVRIAFALSSFLRLLRALRPALLAATLLVPAASGCGARTGLRAERADEPCGTTDGGARLAPLDVFLLVDSSGSMHETTEHDLQKWAEVKKALRQFLQDPRSAGLAASVRFFPSVFSGVPTRCNVEADCNGHGPCELTGVCLPSATALCSDDAGCAKLGAAGDTCRPLGRCTVGAGTKDEETYCLPDYQKDCVEGGALLGACVPVGVCLGRDACQAADYEALDAPVRSLPEGTEALLATLDARKVDGGTPLLPALRGTLAAARAWSAGHADHKVIVVIATDGMPSECDDAIPEHPELVPEHLRAAAAEGVAGGVQTFVLGVFTPKQAAEAELGLGALAEGGGSQHAFIVTTDGKIAAGLLDALTDVRATSRCDYVLGTGAQRVRTETVSVSLPTQSGTRPGTYVPGPSACSDAPGAGYYFDTDVTGAARTSRLVLCPDACAAIAARTAEVRIEATCRAE